MNILRVLKRRLALFLSACMILGGSGVGALVPVQVYAADKIVPHIAQTPVPSPITEGQTLGDSVLTGGVAHVSVSDASVVAGTFKWRTPAIKPKVEDSGISGYSVYFIPNDTDKYERAEFKVRISVNAVPDSGDGKTDEGGGEGGSGEGGSGEGGEGGGGTDLPAEDSPIKSLTLGGGMVKFSKKNVVSTGSINITYNSRPTYTGKTIKYQTLGITADFDGMLDGVVSNPRNYKSADLFTLKVKTKDSLHASVSEGRVSDYVSYPYFTMTMKFNSKAMKNAGISDAEIKAMKKRVRAMKKVLKDREVSFDILPVDISSPSASVTGEAVFVNGKLKTVKNVIVKANCNGEIRTFKLGKKSFYASVLDSQKGIVSITGKNDFEGTCVLK